MINRKYQVGYTQGVFDLFHVGHLNLLNRAKEHCDYLIVGVNSDELVKKYKQIDPTIPAEDRALIVSNLKAVDEVIIVDTLDKLEIYNTKKFNAVFIGDDWSQDQRWISTKETLSKVGVEVVFLPYTQRVSSTMIRKKLHKEEK